MAQLMAKGRVRREQIGTPVDDQGKGPNAGSPGGEVLAARPYRVEERKNFIMGTIDLRRRTVQGEKKAI